MAFAGCQKRFRVLPTGGEGVIRHVDMRDRDVRAAVQGQIECRFGGDPNTRVVHELGLQHGVVRIDIAVINGLLAGYELKSDADTLERLPVQQEAYSAVFDQVTLVAGGRHVEAALTRVPDWWGVQVATQDAGGQVRLDSRRANGRNPAPDGIATCALLWRPEAAELLRTVGGSERELRSPRRKLYAMLVERLPPDELRASVRGILKSRRGWRDPASPVRDDG
jgi:hypothetical protein